MQISKQSILFRWISKQKTLQPVNFGCKVPDMIE